MTKQIFSTAVLFFAMLMTAQGASANELSIRLQPTNGLQAGKVKDGELLLVGNLTDHGAHSGFHIRCDGQTEPGREQVCKLQGIRNPAHVLRVRIDGDGWQAAGLGKTWMEKLSTNDSVMFRLVADGDQVITTDSWTVAFSAGVH